jgi:hypothetical protein
MFQLACEVVIDSVRRWTFDRVNSIEITRDVDTLTDMCTIILPRKVQWEGADRMPLRRGDRVTVRLGYDSELEPAFVGYITTTGFKAPATIKCEDYMFQLKSRPAVKKAYRSATISQILTDQKLGIPFKVSGEQSIGAYRVREDNIAAALDNLKKNGLQCFIKIVEGEPVLYCGIIFPQQSGGRQVFATGVNLISDQSLDVQNSADVKIKLKAISIMPNNTRILVEIGDSDGETRTVHAYNKSRKQLTDFAREQLERLKRDGLTGSFSTFGGRLLDKLDNVAIKIDGEKMGVYQVDKVAIKYSTAGFRQEVTLGQRMAE